MALFFSITLGISIVGLILILVLKRIEMRTGRVMLRGARPSVGRLFAGVLFFLGRVIPGVVRASFISLFHLMKRGVHFIRVEFARMFEKRLEGLLHRVRETTRSERNRGEASGFLREVADHKRSLSDQPESKRTIFDE
jgi:hypothetical protein